MIVETLEHKHVFISNYDQGLSYERPKLLHENEMSIEIFFYYK